MRRAVACLLLIAALGARAETIDRIVLVVARHPITELQLEEELRITAFLNEKPLAAELGQRREAADRLIDQALVQREMQLTHFPPPADEEIDQAFDRLVEEQGGQQRFAQDLDRYQLTASEVRAHLALQIATLRFVAFRFRPELGINDNELKQAYDKERATWAREHPGQPMPTLEASRGSLRRQLRDQETDAAMNDWLAQARRQVRVSFLDKSLETTPQ